MANNYTTKTEKIARKMRLLIIIPAVIFIILFLLAIFIKSNSLSDNDTVFTIDFSKISKSVSSEIKTVDVTAIELENRIKIDKASVIAYYSEKYNLTLNADDWDKKIDGKTPREYLKQYSKNKLIKYKTEQALAVKYKIISSDMLDYDYFLNSMDSTNADNSKKISNGQVVYGAKSYSTNTYLDYTYSNMQLDLQEKLGQKGQALYANDSTLKAWYNSVKATRYPKADKINYISYVLYYEGSAQKNNYTYDEANAIMKKVLDGINKGLSKSDLQKICPDMTIHTQEYNDDNASQLQKQAFEVYESLNSLKPNQVSDVINSNNSAVIVKCNSKTSDGFKSFSENKESIYTEYISEKYDEYIDELVKKVSAKDANKYALVEI